MFVKKGFTLIELLIVVAIIAILAAIAIPNFLQAQVRSKISRSKSELRNVTTALESYYIDNNQYPEPQPTAYYNVPDSLSTPISYVTNIKSFEDPFSKRIAPDSVYHRYGYVTEDWPNHHYAAEFSAATKELIGKYRLDGYGPTEGRAGGWANGPSYDPTNGTVSNGGLYRSQKDPNGIQY